MTTETLPSLNRLRYLSDNAAGTAFLPPAWEELASAIPALLDVAEAAHQLVGVTSHVNCSGPDYAERKMFYGVLRRKLAPLGMP